MEAVMFSLKRAFHSSLKFGRAVLGELRDEGMTPARMDVLYLVACEVDSQAELWRMLGVVRWTISEMLGSLERIGLVRRDPNGRTRDVSLTAKGRELLVRATRRCFGDDGIVPRVMDKILCGADLSVDQYWAESQFHDVCERFRWELGDTAAQEIHPWHPDGYMGALCDVVVSDEDPERLDETTLKRVRVDQWPEVTAT